ncbi:MAG: citramalate synthase [Acidimicrobiia bacterium]
MDEEKEKVYIFDTTLRDGSQLEGISLSVEDKFAICEQLDLLGVDFIEAGWPGANPKDSEFFSRAKDELHLMNSRLVAFGSTRKANNNAQNDPVMASLLEANVDDVCIFGKTWDYHVTETLKTSLDEGIKMIFDSVSYLVSKNKTVHFDAEHFFDGYKNNPKYALDCIESACNAGAKFVVLCDTNGGTLPHEIKEIISQVKQVLTKYDVVISIHTHDDGALAVANALEAVRAGAREVQGTINGYGERTGNCNLIPVIANLSLKTKYKTNSDLSLLSNVAISVAELVNMPLNPQAAYVGEKAFAHKAGVHTSAISRRSDAYEHIDPSVVGNKTRFVVSEMAGKSAIEIKAHELGIELTQLQISELTQKLKELEYNGYHFEVAEASLELLMRKLTGYKQDWFEIIGYEVQVNENNATSLNFDESSTLSTTAKIELRIGSEKFIEMAHGNGPVNALDNALRQAISSKYPQINKVHLLDYKVRILNSDKATGAVTRVLIVSSNGNESWTTIGVSQNIIEASWQALCDALIIGLIRTQD